MFEVGRLVVKIAGRDGGKKAVVINVLDDKFVTIDGETRRRKCNVAHLEPLGAVIKINKDASHDEIKKEFSKLGLKVKETKPKEKKERPKKIRKKKVVEGVKEEKEEKKPRVEKKEEKPSEEKK